MRELELGLSIDEVNLILEALGSLPFAQVYTLVGKIQQQAAAQLEQSNVTALDNSAPRQAAAGR